MKVIKPSTDPNYIFKCIPRVYEWPEGLELTLYDTTTQTEQAAAIYSDIVTDGILEVRFNAASPLVEGDFKIIKLYEKGKNNPIYLGQLLVTEQNAEEFSSTKNLYFYE